MPDIKLATFNCENLMMRCDFDRAGLPRARDRLTDVDEIGLSERVDDVFDVLSDDDRTLTAQALAATGAEVCALQEVENLVTLTAFDRRHLAAFNGAPHDHRVLIEGNDARGIDVALLSKLDVVRTVSHRRQTYGLLNLRPPKGLSVNDYAFRRDCLEVDVAKEGRALTLFVCHFKSMHGGRTETRAQREAEARAVRQLIEARFADPAAAEWAILGDFNDYLEIDGVPVKDSGLGPLTKDGFAIDLLPLAMDDPHERWTHHYSGEDTYSALDHIFLSPRLAALNPAPKAAIIRGGLPHRAERYQGFRFPGVGWNLPKASDHCPLTAELVFEGRALEV